MTSQQIMRLEEELNRVKVENDCLLEKYESLLEIHKIMLRKCRCKGDIKTDNFEKSEVILKNIELEKKVKSLENQVSLLEIQLSTYKEDFEMERKDREAAQDRVIRLEQELTDLCSKGCSNKCSKLNTTEGCQEPQSFELLPSPADFDYLRYGPTYETDRKEQKSKNEQNPIKEKSKSLKNVISSIVGRHQKEFDQEPSSKTLAREALYHIELDGQDNKEAQLRGRKFNPNAKDESFLFVQNCPESIDFPSKQSSPSPLKRDINIVDSQTPSVVRVRPHSSSKSPNRQLHNIAQSWQTTGPEEILRCPACFRAFKASTEHYKLLQHMDSCGQ